MSNPNPILAMYGLEAQRKDAERPFAALPTRAEVLSSITTDRNVDLLILGGGLTAALVAHQATLRGIKVLALTASFFGDRALSWKPRIAHLLRTRPLEVLRGRSTLRVLEKEIAPHLISQAPADSHPSEGFLSKLAQRWTPDLDLNEGLLVREAILAARQEGAMALAAAEPTYVEAESTTGCYIVGFRDVLTDNAYNVRVGGILLDPSGAALPPSRLGTPVLRVPEVRRAGVQCVYEVVPRTTKSGFRFASFELSDGSFISVQRISEQRIEVTVLEGASSLAPSVIDTICTEAAAESGWRIVCPVSVREVGARWSAHYRVSESRGIFTCAQRGPWDAVRSANSIVKTLASYVREQRVITKIPARPLPGAEQACELNAFRAQARGEGVSEESIELCIARWQGRVRYLAQFPQGLTPLCRGVLRAEVDLAYVSDQITTTEDIIFGSLQLHRIPGWQELVPAISERVRELTSLSSS
jgi:hypothetical protein